MFNPRITALAAVLVGLMPSSLALGADYGVKYGYPPPPVEIGSGWYLRGDLGYRLYAAPSMSVGGTALTGTSAAGAISFGGGFGYQFSHGFRGDITADYALPAAFRGTLVGGCDSGGADCTYSVNVSAATVMANAYWDLATIGSITPYVGAGVGVAYLSTGGSSAIDESIGPPAVSVPGASRINFAWAVMGGATWEMSPDTLIDLSFKLVSLGSARTGADPVGDDGSPVVTGNIFAPEVRLGMRYIID